MSIFEKFKLGFKKSASNIASGLKEIIIKKEIDDNTLDKNEIFIEKKGVVNGRPTGKGLYTAVGISSFSSSLAYTDVSLSGGLTGDGSVDLNIDTTIVKLGLKTGGTLYFSFELGYGFGTIPDSLTFNAVSSTGISESVTEDIPNIPGIGSGGMIVGNIGFGISF